MKKTIFFIAFILFSNLFIACSNDSNPEEEITNTSMEVFATGDDDAGDIDDEQDGN